MVDNRSEHLDIDTVTELLDTKSFSPDFLSKSLAATKHISECEECREMYYTLQSVDDAVEREKIAKQLKDTYVTVKKKEIRKDKYYDLSSDFDDTEKLSVAEEFTVYSVSEEKTILDVVVGGTGATSEIDEKNPNNRVDVVDGKVKVEVDVAEIGGRKPVVVIYDEEGNSSELDVTIDEERQIAYAECDASDKANQRIKIY